MSKHLLDLRAPELPASAIHALPDTMPPVRFIDRVSLRLALWLLLRSTRHVRHHADRDVHARLLANERDRAAREAALLRWQLLAPRH